MIHPSYVELMKVVNHDVEIGEEPVVNSRYSIVIATAKRARQIIGGDEPLVPHPEAKETSLYRGRGALHRKSQDHERRRKRTVKKQGGVSKKIWLPFFTIWRFS